MPGGYSIAPSPLSETGWITLCVALVAGAFFPFAFYASSGLETSLYLLCLIAGADLHLRAADKQRAMFYGLSTLSLLCAALLRPEGIGFLLISSAFLAARTRRSGPFVLHFVVLALAAYGAVLIMKYGYFDRWVPNTYFAKPGAAWTYLTPLVRGAEYLTLFFGRSGVIVLLPFAAFYRRVPGASYAWYYLWSLLACQIAFILFVGGDVLRFDRFAVPLFPWLLVLAGLGALHMLNVPASPQRSLAKKLFAVSVAFVIILNAGRAVVAHGKLCQHDWMSGQVQREIGLLLGDLLPPGSEVVTNEVGAVKFYSRLPVVDMLGLTDDTISAIRYRSFRTWGVGSSEWSAAMVADYVFERKPEAVLLPSTFEIAFGPGAPRRGEHPLVRAIRTAPEFVRYRPVLGVRIHETKYFYLFLRYGTNLSGRLADRNPHECLDMWHIDEN